MKTFSQWLVLVLLLRAVDVHATTYLDPVEGQKEARVLVDRLLSLQPDGDYTNYGTLKISPKDKRKRTEMPIQITVKVNDTNWVTTYEAKPTNGHGVFVLTFNNRPTNTDSLRGAEGFDGMEPFAGSDFSNFDLSLGFLHWPAQKILKKEIKLGRGCSVLESANPDPNSKGYSRVLTWIDNDSLGVVQAEAYDAKGDLLKEFIPKSVTKVNGQWQVEAIEMDNDQTDSRTIIHFDLGK